MIDRVLSKSRIHWVVVALVLGVGLLLEWWLESRWHPFQRSGSVLVMLGLVGGLRNIFDITVGEALERNEDLSRINIKIAEAKSKNEEDQLWQNMRDEMILTYIKEQHRLLRRSAEVALVGTGIWGFGDILIELSGYLISWFS